MTTTPAVVVKKRKCSGQVWPTGRWPRPYACSNPATVEENGQWWCKSHAPSFVEQRRKKREAKWRAKNNEREARRDRAAKIEAARHAVIQAAKRFAPDIDAPAYLEDAVAALAQLEKEQA